MNAWNGIPAGTPEDAIGDPDALRHAGDIERLAPELTPALAGPPAPDDRARIDIAQLGRPERSHWGTLPMLRGIEAVRGACFAHTVLCGMDVSIDGIRIHRTPLSPGTAVPGTDGLLRHVFNAWVDVSAIAAGRHALELLLYDGRGGVHERREPVLVGAPLDPVRHADSDAVLPPHDGDEPLDAWVAARPSMVRSARRPRLAAPPRAVLVQRMDQLGDLVVSIPALIRLRALFGSARLVGLMTPVNAELARTLGLFDDIVVADFPVDARRGRTMATADQIDLRERLAGYAFDIAIDLSESAASRALLLLSGAPFLYGFGSGEFGYLAAQAEGYTQDRANRHETVPHATKLLALVEWLAALLADPEVVICRPDLDPARLSAFGLAPGERYVVLHDGARLAFTRWPHYARLADMIRAAGLRVVLIADDPAIDAAHPSDDGIVRLTGRIPFDDFDALLSFAAAFVGNDSGPKHLAALRGVPVVSLHMSRNNWNEWGQVGPGVILSRKLPCAGCLIGSDAGLCGRDFVCITGIAPDEVLAALTDVLRAAG